MSAAAISAHSQVPSFLLNPSCSDKYDLIATIVAPVLLIVAASLVTYYAIYPITPMVQITANFSLSLPVVICGSAGAILLVILSIQIGRKEVVSRAFQRARGYCVRHFVHMGGRSAGKTPEHYAKAHKTVIAFIEQNVGPQVQLMTRDGVTLSGFWDFKEQNAPTVILFHGNNGAAFDVSMWRWSQYYQSFGFNVLLAEYRGYGLSKGQAGGPNQELEAYLDAEAALKFVLSQGVQKSKIISHGFSLGGIYSAALIYFYGIKAIVLDHTCTSLKAVADHKIIPLGRHIAPSYMKGALEPDPDIPGALPLETDCFNILAKVQKIAGEVFVICGKNDKMMPLKFGKQIMQARYPNDAQTQADNMVVIGGGHCDVERFFDTGEPRIKLEIFLQRNGLI